MRYTISAAFVIDCDDDKIEQIGDDHLHKTIVEKIQTFGMMLRTQFPEREFRVALTDMIIASPEIEIAPKE